MAETITVLLEGAASATVDIDGVDLFTDSGLTIPATFPSTVSSDTSWYAANPTVPGHRQVRIVVALADGTRTVDQVVHALPQTVDAVSGAIIGVDGAASGGGSSQLQHIQFDFTFDTPGLSDGVPIGYTPAVGDILLAAWFSIPTAWDGTTPGGDFGYAADSTGVFNNTVGSQFFTSADTSALGGKLVWGTQEGTAGFFLPNTGNGPQLTAADPLNVWVSQDSTQGGADPAATQGAASLHLLVVPASLT